jgi:hypothetical protein
MGDTESPVTIDHLIKLVPSPNRARAVTCLSSCNHLTKLVGSHDTETRTQDHAIPWPRLVKRRSPVLLPPPLAPSLPLSAEKVCR